LEESSENQSCIDSTAAHGGEEERAEGSEGLDDLGELYLDKESLLPLIRTDLVQYCLALNPRWRPARHLLYLADRLMAAERRAVTRLVVTMPPQHGKSWTTSQHFPAWYLGRHPEHSVITGAYNETKALDFGLSVKDQVNDPLFRLVFPELTVRRDSNSALKFTTEQGGSYFAVGRAARRPAGGPTCSSWMILIRMRKRCAAMRCGARSGAGGAR
jgi:hypothetical protein